MFICHCIVPFALYFSLFNLLSFVFSCFVVLFVWSLCCSFMVVMLFDCACYYYCFVFVMCVCVIVICVCCYVYFNRCLHLLFSYFDSLYVCVILCLCAQFCFMFLFLLLFICFLVFVRSCFFL